MAWPQMFFWKLFFEISRTNILRNSCEQQPSLLKVFTKGTNKSNGCFKRWKSQKWHKWFKNSFFTSRICRSSHFPCWNSHVELSLSFPEQTHTIWKTPPQFWFVFRTYSNIQDGAFCGKNYWFLRRKLFPKKSSILIVGLVSENAPALIHFRSLFRKPPSPLEQTIFFEWTLELKSMLTFFFF